MLIAIDVYYTPTGAKSVSVEFDDWQQATPDQTHIVYLDEVAEYIPGQFYKRELPCIMEVLKCSNLTQVEAIIVDGYVQLDAAGKLGLGGYLYEALDKQIPVIGVAKRAFHDNEKHARPIKRGQSENPLFVSAVGIDLAEAVQKVQDMAGDYRMPDLLRILDQETKKV